MTLRELVLRPSSGIGQKCLLDGKQCLTVFCTVAKVQNLAIDCSLIYVRILQIAYFANCGLRKHTL